MAYYTPDLLFSNRVIGRKYSTNRNKSSNLNPYWVTGFADAEGCFSVILSQRANSTWRVSVSFEINLHTKDKGILNEINNFFGVGHVTSRETRNICVFRVTKIEDLINVIIPHFLNFPLLTLKYSDFVLWSKVVNLLHLGQHQIPSVFSTILSYYASINKGMSAKVSAAFPNIIPFPSLTPVLPASLNPYWVSGFTAGDGGFSIGIRPLTGQIYFRLFITQHNRDILLMNLLIEFFGCGKVNEREIISRCDFYIQDFNNIYSIVIPHFDQFALNNIKELDYTDFKKAAELYKVNGRGSTEAIRDIISNMNSKRI